MILEEEIDPNYVPTEKGYPKIIYIITLTLEIHEYAEFLGINPATESKYLYIAIEGLKAPLPKNWKPCKTKEGELYYFNFESGESIWEHPCDMFYK